MGRVTLPTRGLVTKVCGGGQRNILSDSGGEMRAIEAEVGTLEAGKRADVLVVRGNPLERIEVLEEGVAYVFKQGARVVDNVGVPARSLVA